MSKDKFFKLPLDSMEMMFAESLLDNSGLTVTNTYIASFYRIYFFNKLLSIMQIEGLPDTINERYFKNTLLTRGNIAIFNTKEYGVIANKGAIYDYDIYYNPTSCRMINPKYAYSYEREIVYKDSFVKSDNPYKYCALVKLSPNFETVLPIIYYYADLMAVAVQGIDSNVLNSKLAYVFGCDNQQTATSFKKMMDEITNGYPAVFADKKLFDDEGNLKMQMFNQDLKSTYIADKLMELKVDIENEFNSFIGLSVVNTDKRERLITPEIELSNNNNQLIVELWENTINDGLNIANELFNLNISCSLNVNFLNGEVQADVQTET